MPKTFKDFSGGWSGTLDLAKVPDTMYDGRNVMLYRDGTLGPRPGLRAFNLARSPGGPIRCAAWAGNDLLFYVDGLQAHFVSALNDGANATYVGDIAAAPDYDLPITINHKAGSNGVVGITVPGDAMYQATTAALSNLFTTFPTGPAVALGFVQANYAQRGIFAVMPFELDAVDGGFFTIYYSEIGNPYNWPALNFITLPSRGDAIVHLVTQRNHYLMVTDVGEFFILTGSPGVNDTLRRIAAVSLTDPAAAEAFVKTADEVVHYLSPINNYPASFDGATHEAVRYLSMTPEDPRAGYAAGLDLAESQKGVQAFWAGDVNSPGFLLKSPTNRMLIKQYGAWCLHEFGVEVSQSWTGDGRGRVYGFLNDYSAAVLDLSLDRPAFASDTFAQPGDLTDVPVDAYFTLPEQWTDDNNHQQVSEVVLNITRWDTGATGDNSFSVTVDALSRGSEVPLRSQTQDWVQATNLSPATQAGVQDQVRMQFGEQGEGAGYRIRITNIKGVAFRSITVNDRLHETNQRIW